MALAIFIPNLAGIYQPILELYQTAIHPALSPEFGQFIWLVRMARNSRGSGFTNVANPPNTVAKTVGQLWSDVREEVWFG